MIVVDVEFVSERLSVNVDALLDVSELFSCCEDELVSEDDELEEFTTSSETGESGSTVRFGP
jgi:preprotein translocase subunit Sec63